MMCLYLGVFCVKHLVCLFPCLSDSLILFGYHVAYFLFTSVLCSREKTSSLQIIMAEPAEKHLMALSDENIIADLQTFKPVDQNCEKNVWAFWDKGLDKAPDWNKRDIVS